MTDILTDIQKMQEAFAVMIQKMQEAYAVMHGIQIERKFSDRELEGYRYELSVAKTDIEEMIHEEQT